jgi:hypothetical protein
MSRQPFLPTHEGDDSWIVGNLAIIQHPRLGALILDIITTWPYVEMMLGVISAEVMGANSEAMMAGLTKLRQYRLSQDVIMGAADITLADAKDRKLLSAVLEVCKGAQKERDAIAHGIWGRSANLPDAALWVETSHAAPWAVGFSRASAEDLIFKRDPMHAALAQKLYVYEEKDLKEVAAQIQEAWMLASQMAQFLRADSALRGPLYDLISNAPRIRSVLDRPNLS